tara:strand:+ start:3004 stop:3168 length:165 start_codon:yes stop_codon:yes gene_type:complete
MQVRVMMILEIDPEDYPVPVDESLEDEIYDLINDTIYDTDGVKISKIKVIQDDK